MEQKLSYKDSINLPRTNFSMKADLVKKEPALRQKWAEMNLYRQIRKSRRAKPKYILHDGPPYANGDIHVGTGITKIDKDIVVRFKTMQGFDAPFIPGWDCHGMPIEHKVMEQLGARARTMSKPDIRKECEKYARKFIDIQRRQFQSLGVLGDWENPYLTLNPEYEAAVIEVFADLVEKGFIYRKLKPIHWCMQCETALAEAELEYADETGPSIYVKFSLNTYNLSGLPKILDRQLPDLPVSFLIWTTTPWTLPANVAVALNPAFEYALVKSAGEYLIIALGLVEKVMGLLNRTYTIEDKITGDKLEGLGYIHPLGHDYYCKTILANYVSLEDGTGLVHIAPGHGTEDYESGLKYNLPVVSPVDKSGRFTSQAGPFAGENVFDADDKICQVLGEKKLLLKRVDIVHSYPHCWRCKKPVIFRATEQWFISVDHNNMRKKALDAVDKVKWIPSWGKTRISRMLEARPDWCISRQRNWGIPIPVFYCTKCHEPLLDKKIIDRVRDMFLKDGAMSWFVKEPAAFLPPGTKCPCGQTEFVKENDIFDVWFESASSHRAVVMKHQELSFPADLYIEGTDQHRGWFQVSLLASVMTQGIAPFKTVVTNGFVVDEAGEKLSKSKGMFTPIDQIVEKYGADLVRLWFTSIDFTGDIPFSFRILQDKSDSYRKVRNTFRYLLGNLYDFNPATDTVKYDHLWEIDKWALAKLHRLIHTVTEAYEAFEFHKVYREIYEFCVVEMSSFYIDVLKDRLYTFAKNSPARRAGQTVLYEIVTALTKLSAPILVHTAEEVWGEISLSPKPNSVHLADFPIVNRVYLNEELETNWATLMKIKSEVSRELDKLRKDGTLGNSLEAEVTLYTDNQDLQKLLREHESTLAMVLIVSQTHLAKTKPAGAVQGLDLKDLWLTVIKSRYQKCERCWNYRPAVGNDPNYPTLCDRCIPVVNTN